MIYRNNIFQITNNNIIPKKGNILISEPFLMNKYFGRSVVLLVEHESSGSMGFVLNKPIKETFNDFFPEVELKEKIPVFCGGPVSPNRLYYIHTLGKAIPDSYHVTGKIYFGGDFEVIKAYMNQGNPVKGVLKFFMGYSGWEEDQLENEITGNSWLVGKPDVQKIMKSENEIYWKRALEDLGEKYRFWANFPQRPFMN